MTKQEKLDELKKQIQKNKELPLRNQATQLVFGVGNANAEILFIGEAPGYWEDQRGEPFVGNAGKLLDKALQSIEVKRSDVFITNVVMYRPPQNRDPLQEELEAFHPYVAKIVEIINPKLIVTLGRFSMAKFLKDAKITLVHGKLYKKTFEGKSVYIMPMFHPSAALRAPAVMKMFNDDFARLPKALEKIKSL